MVLKISRKLSGVTSVKQEAKLNAEFSECGSSGLASAHTIKPRLSSSAKLRSLTASRTESGAYFSNSLIRE